MLINSARAVIMRQGRTPQKRHAFGNNWSSHCLRLSVIEVALVMNYEIKQDLEVFNIFSKR